MRAGHEWTHGAGSNMILRSNADLLALLTRSDGSTWTLSMYTNPRRTFNDFVSIPLAPASAPRPDLDYVYSLFLLRYEGAL